MIYIRPETPDDIPAIRRINVDAFPTSAEAGLVDALREKVAGCISLVAEKDVEVAGHIMFSPVTLKERETSIKIAGLAPMAVLPAYQNQGIGSALVEAGLKTCEENGYEAVVVLGHPDFYPRFGFVPSVRYGIRSTYEVPDEVFMVTALKPGVLDRVQGTVVYDPCFDEL